MVEVQKRKVLIKRKPSSEDGAERIIEIETNMMDYGASKVEGTDIVISVAVATFELKGEDKHHVIRLGDDIAFGTFLILLRLYVNN
jgi:hypothetical protein